MRYKNNIKTVLFLLLALCMGLQSRMFAQSSPFLLQSYTYSTGVGTSSSWLSPTLTYSSIVTGDDVASSLCNLGFGFVFEGTVYSQFSVNTNGNLRLGSTQISGSYYATPLGTSYISYNTPKIIGVGADLYGTSLTYGVAGTAPNRIGVFTFNGYPYSGSSYTFSFQVQLYEGSGEIRIVYGACAESALNRVFQIGIASSASDVAVVDQTTHTVSYAATSTAYSTWPGQYRYYSFIPDTSLCTYPYNLSVTQAGQNSVSLDWDMYIRSSSRPTYIVEYGITGFSQGSGTQIFTTTKPILISGLQQNVDYTFYVRAVCDTNDTSQYSHAANYIICSGNTNTCLDFTALNSPGVTCTYGTYNNYNSYTSSYPGPYAYVGVLDNGQNNYGSYGSTGSRHTVHTHVGEMDSCSGYNLSKIPPGECKSVRLGCIYGQYLCQAVTYDISVDTNVSDIILLKYACVFYNPSHPDNQQPRFVLEILDTAGNMVDVTCGYADFNATNASSANSGWNQGISYGIYWKDWTPVGLHVASYHGQTIKVRLTSFACGQGASEHFGYAYYTLSCTKAKIRSSSCVMGGQSTLSAPLGFNYRWFSSSDTTRTISTNRQVDVILDSNSYFCDVSFIDNPGCKFRMSYNHLLVGDTLRDTIRQVICPGDMYVHNNDTMTTTGWYRQEFVTAGGCDSLLTINVVVTDTTRDTVRRTLCAGATFDTNGQRYTRTGFYHQLRRDATTGCYSLLYIDLVVNDTIRDTVRRTLCAGASFDTNGQQYTRTGFYRQLRRDPASGCYSLLYIDLVVNDTLRDTVHRVFCAGQSFDTNGHSYTRTGFYSQLLRDSTTGCYTRLYIDIVINSMLCAVYDTVSICSADLPYLWHGHRYDSSATYIDTLTSVSGHDSIVILTLIVIPNPTLQHSPDTTIMAGNQVSLSASGATFITWTDLNSNNASSGGNLTVSPAQTTPYLVSGYNQGQSIVFNGDFEQGNSGFTTSYNYNSYLVPEGNYYVGTNARNYHTGFYSMPDHTSGMGNYMIVNGNTVPNSNVWTQTVSVTPNTSYAFSVWACSIGGTATTPTNVAQLQFSINGSQVGNVFVAPSTFGVWSRYYQVWNSGNSTTAVITILNQNTMAGGNDFGIDDISFSPLAVCPSFDTVTVHVVHRQDSSICSNLLPFVWEGHRFNRSDTASVNLTDSHGRDSVLFLNLTVNPTYNINVYDTICAGASYTYDTNIYTVSGRYVQRHQTMQGCDSVININLTVRDTLRDTIHRAICKGRTFDTIGQRYSQTGLYSQLLRDSVSQCFNRLYIDVLARDTFRVIIWHDTCAGATFTHGGQTYSRQGTYFQRLQTVYGCDSITEIHLTVADTIRDTLYYAVCAGKTVEVNGTSYYRRGWYRQRLRTPNGCDSILHIRLDVADTIRDTLYYTVCAGKTVEVNGSSYYRQGWYRQRLRTPDGCDSILHIALMVDDTIRAHDYDTICNGHEYRYHGSTYRTAGAYRHLLRTPDGCDSIVTMHLYVRDTAVTHIYDTIERGESYEFFGQQYTQQGVYRHVLTRVVNGCDSTIVLHLKVCHTIYVHVYDTICVDGYYHFGDTIVMDSGIYTRVSFNELNCDSLITLHLYTIPFPTLTLVDSGGYCEGGIATISAQTNGNYITWTSMPPDTTMIGQEHEYVLHVSPQRYVEYIATVDIQPYDCLTTGVISLNKPESITAAMAINPLEITNDNLQTRFSDVSIGDVATRKWLFHEDDAARRDLVVLNDSLVYYTPSPESDSIEVTLMVASATGCRDTVINIYPILKGDLWVPNAFTPGRHTAGQNYLFRVGYNNVIDYEIYIYNRAGLLVFHSTNPDISWDGTHNHKDCVAGSYVYKIHYTTKKHPKTVLEKVGSVLLIR